MAEGWVLEGVDELMATLARLPRELAAGANDGHRQLAEREAAEIRARAPQPPGASGEATGKLADKVRVAYGAYNRSPFFADVVVGEEGETPYLGHYEFGTRRQAARPFVRPAAARAEASHESTMLAAARRRIA